MIRNALGSHFYILQGNMCVVGLLAGWGRILGLMQIPMLHSSDLPHPHLISIPKHNQKQMKTTSDLPMKIVRSKYNIINHIAR